MKKFAWRGSVWILVASQVLLCAQSSPKSRNPTPTQQATAKLLAPTPPMGWNSYDSYGTTVKEADVKANALWLAHHLKRYGWQYVVIDMEWFVTNPTPSGNGKDSLYSMDENGRYIPAP